MKLPDPPSLVAAAKAALDAPTDDDLVFALRTRYGLRPSQSLVNRWRNGQSSPRYPYTIALLDAAGWLNQDRVEGGLAAADAARREAEEAERRARDAREGPPLDERETG